MWRGAGLAVLGLLLPFATGGTTARAESGRPAVVTEALRYCVLGERASTQEEKVAAHTRGRELAEQAVEQYGDDAAAHFALFCNLGRLVEMDIAAGLANPLGLARAVRESKRVRREVDRAIELQPDYTDALAAKGAMLVRLPQLLGGDPRQGEALLHRVLVLQPAAVRTRMELARVYDDRGDRERAVEQVRTALGLAEQQGRWSDAAEARRLLQRMTAAQ
jgi:tetratricopeptide (TPR) repeat protein